MQHTSKVKTSTALDSITKDTLISKPIMLKGISKHHQQKKLKVIECKIHFDYIEQKETFKTLTIKYH